MAKLAALPDSQTRAASTGLIDYYMWMGQVPVARKWPRYKAREATAAELANQQRFTVVARATTGLSPAVKALWMGMPTTTATTWVDVFRATVLRAGWLHV